MIEGCQNAVVQLWRRLIEPTMSLPRLLVSSQKTKKVHSKFSKHEFIMHDPDLCLCPGLFRHLRPLNQAQSKVEMKLVYAPREDALIEFQSAHLLGGFDVAVLQSAASLGHSSNDVRLCSGAGGAEQESLVPDLAGLINALNSNGECETIDGKVLIASFSIQSLLRVAGLPENGRNSNLARESLRRLAGVTVIVRNPLDESKRKQFPLISVDIPLDQADKGFRVHIGINAQLTRHLLRKERHHTRISLAEARKLGGDFAARVLHQRLCAVINDDDYRDLRMQTLVEYLYPDDTMTAATDKLRAEHTQSYAKLLMYPDRLRQQRFDETTEAMAALKERLGWSIELLRHNGDAEDALWRIRRTKSSRTKSELRALRASSGK